MFFNININKNRIKRLLNPKITMRKDEQRKSRLIDSFINFGIKRRTSSEQSETENKKTRSSKRRRRSREESPETSYFTRKLANAVTYLLLLGLFLYAGQGAIESLSGDITETPVVVIDAGHGGIDGGAVSADGTSEKDINLSIARMLRDLAETEGINVVMTRDSEGGLYTDVENDGTENAKITGNRSIRSLKTEDLHNRKALIDSTMPDAMVSIHLNSFKEDRSVRGAQVFYTTSGDQIVTDASKSLAESIQTSIATGIADGNTRQPLGKNDVTILKNALVPSVIVECGFLSNAGDLANLKDEEYCKKLAQSIYNGLKTYLQWESIPETNINIITSDY